jgi:hypothetical protein
MNRLSPRRARQGFGVEWMQNARSTPGNVHVRTGLLPVSLRRTFFGPAATLGALLKDVLFSPGDDINTGN